ncbi:MAG: ATP-dependent helicase [Candidatus Micrarchaeaceae archaeon]
MSLTIQQYGKPFSDEESLSSLNGAIREWFVNKYKELTPPQKYSFKLIREGKNLLITAPTGSGKTFSAFMAILSDLMDMAEKGELEDKTYCIYISPLRALDNDIYKNLKEPLDEIYAKLGDRVKRITVGVRTGDTEQKERQRQLVRPPNILVTTPESIAILLNAKRFSENLKNAKYVVIDEIHELANNKRGVHLALSLERLTELSGRELIRIGIGATLYPLEEAARFLVGCKPTGEARDCYVIDATWEKRMQYQAISPVSDLINAPDAKVEGAIYRLLDKIIKENKATLIFTNTRSGTERVVYNLMSKFKYGEEDLAAHHGSLSRETRLEVEEMLKKGKLKCVVSSTSLELGIDIGAIDDVVQLGSPKSVTRAIQRIGRSGHGFYDVAKGEIIVTNRDDLVECSVMLYAAKNRHLDSFSVPKNALDVLAQHIVGMSLTKKWRVDDAYTVIRQAYPYSNLPRKDFEALLEYLSGSYVGLESRRVYGKIWYEPENGEFGKRGRFTKLIYYLNLGTIPDTVAVDVYTTEHKWLGSIEEEFLSRLKPGDIFTLGGKLYRFEYSRQLNCYVSPAKSKMPTIPPWFSEQLPLTYELALEIGKFRAELAEAVAKDVSRSGSAVGLIRRNRLMPGPNAAEVLNKMPIDENAKKSIFVYFAEQLLFAKRVPNDKLVLVETTRDVKTRRNYIVFHSLYGRRVNDALSRLFAIAFASHFETEVGITISDNGFVIVLDESLKVLKKDIDEVFSVVLGEDIASVLKGNIRRTEMMKRRFRHCAVRGFMVLRNYKGKKISVRRQQVNSEALLSAVEEISPDFPILKETYREILDDVMDMPRAREVLSSIKSGGTKYEVIETPIPSPFSHILITFGEADIVMMKDRRKHLRELRKYVLSRIKQRKASR